MNKVRFVVLNMDKNVERLKNISQNLKTYNIPFLRVRAINGYDMANDEDAKLLLAPRKHLLGAIFQSVETKKKWVYDGTIHKSFPNLNLFGHYGTKGLTLSNIKAFYIISKLNMNYEWFCILEDDAELDDDSYNKIKGFVENQSNSNYDIVLLDVRHNGFGGTCAVMYNKRIIPSLICDLHPLSKFSILANHIGDRNLGNLWDWKLWKYLNFVNKNFTSLPCVSSGKFISTIS